MDENDLESMVKAAPAYDTNLSDVIEVIQETDPEFTEATTTAAQTTTTMYNGGGEMSLAPNPVATQSTRTQARIRIVEQPASKALRFRYECEGRSAGSIPGASSTPESKTYPTIKVEGYRGRAVVVVSCVTKDDPYKAHPHNLVGREGCRRGVCTMEISPDSMTVQFSNLGIQCVKKRDIEQALRVREDIRVDPFRQGFNHRNQPTAIDLNAVRLCFQVFLENPDQPGKFTIPLTPVVSEPIYDKKAMSDLTIIKLSDCVSYVDGGRKDIILLCEKVAKEDIQVRFYEVKDERIVWEANADIQPTQVHKQHAIWFRTPKYHTLDVTEPVKVFIQLRRPSDDMTSDPLPFELLPLNSGRPPYWSYRKDFAKKVNTELLNSILVNDLKLAAKTPPNNVHKYSEVSSVAADSVMETNKNDTSKPVETWININQTNIQMPVDTNENIDVINNNIIVTEEKSFNELINQVEVELDEIYSDTHDKLLKEIEQMPSLTNEESFDDSRTYTSFQLALKNPVDITEIKQIKPPSPILEVVPNKRENDTERLPPLPPKRTKKLETYIGGSMTSIQLTGKQAEKLLTRSNSNLKSTSVSRSSSFNLQRPKSQSDLVPPGKRLPPTPNYSTSTLPNPKKRGFFSKLFSRKSKTPSASREASVTPSYTSSKSLQTVSNVNVLHKSTGNISTHSSSSIRIPLKDSPPNSVTNVVADNDIDMNLDLTEAENYALYTRMAPFATQSEFDEVSCYYAPVEGGKLLTNAEVAARFATS